MLLTQQWVQFFSSSLVTIRAQLHSSPRHYNPVRHATVPLTASCWPLTLPSSTSGILLKAAASTFSLTTIPSPMLCRRIQTASPPSRSDTWTTSPSSRLSHPYQPLPALTFALTTSTLILLDPSHTPEDTRICLPALTASHVGLKPSLYQR